MEVYDIHVLLIAFIEPPLSFNATQGSAVIFHCRINETEQILFWLINDEISNSDANRNRSVSIWKENNVVSTLTIVAHPWNKNAQVQCAFRTLESRAVDCGDELVTCSEKAALKIQGDLMLHNFHGLL